MKVKLFDNQPCLRPSYYPLDSDHFFTDEIRRTMTPCPKSEFFDTLTDPRYTLVPGGYTLSKGLFEDENGLSDIWSARYDYQGESGASLTLS